MHGQNHIKFICAFVLILDSEATDIPCHGEMSVWFWLAIFVIKSTEFKLGTNNLLTSWGRVMDTNLLKFPDLFRILVFITN